MIVVRDVYQVKFGQIDQLIALFDEARRTWARRSDFRLLTDASGPLYTLVAETQVPSFAEWEKNFSELFANAEFVQWFARMTPLIESGRREFYNLVEWGTA